MLMTFGVANYISHISLKIQLTHTKLTSELIAKYISEWAI